MDVNAAFYDIESLDNVFTLAVYYPAECKDKMALMPDETYKDKIDIYILDDNLLHWVPNPDIPGVTILPETEGKFIYDRILAANPTMTSVEKTIVTFRNLHDESAAKMLARKFCATIPGVDITYYPEDYDTDPKTGKRVLKPIKSDETNPFHAVSDTDANYDNTTCPYLIGYNSFNYDTTMLALLFMEMFGSETFNKHLTARTMRDHNNELFTSKYKGSMTSYLTRDTSAIDDDFYASSTFEQRRWDNPENLIRQSMMRTGRHIDAARLNEKQVKVALKRLLGLIGAQILESQALDSAQSHIDTLDQFADLVAYNVSDVVNLKLLFNDRSYAGQFATKRNMLETYPELIYEYKKSRQKDENNRLIVDTSRVRRNRLYADSSSQQLSSRTLCPEGYLTDKVTVQFNYPGIENMDVLDFVKKFYDTEVMPLVPKDSDWYEEARAQFERVYDMYDSLRNHNCNDSDRQLEQYNELSGPEAQDLMRNPRELGAKCARYIGADGMPTSCYISFSTGGIHGAEYNKALYDADMAAYKFQEKLRKELTAAGFDTTNDEGATALRNSVTRLKDPLDIEFSDGVPRYCSDFLKSGSTKIKAKWKDNPKPELFNTSSKKGSMSLNKRYVFTSAVQANHEDFTSYYPGLLRQLGAFENKMLGYDRYGEIFEGKERFGRIMKDMSLTQDERDFARAQRENVKLILNSASGGGDAKFDTPIRMNNNIIAMRCIGQLFTWYIGQAQAIKGARVPSTNTDGLYTVLDRELNDKTLAQAAKSINVPIEPEPLWLISKDSNNRIEFEVDDDKSINIISASGDLACWRGPSTSKSLDHPASTNNVLVRYMTCIVADKGQDALYEPFDRELGMKFLQELTEDDDLGHCLLMFQNILASSPSSYKYIFATDIGVKNPRVSEGTAHPLQHYNRIFMVTDDCPGAVNVMAAAGAIVTPAVKRTRKRNNERPYNCTNKLAIEILAASGVCKMPKHLGIDAIPELESNNREATIRRIPNISPETPVLVENNDIIRMNPTRAKEIISYLDLETYLDMVQSAYEDNWRNKRPLKNLSQYGSIDI